MLENGKNNFNTKQINSLSKYLELMEGKTMWYICKIFPNLHYTYNENKFESPRLCVPYRGFWKRLGI